MPNTGEVTEDYGTYMRHMAMVGAVGFFLGVIMTLIGIFTNWYQRILTAAGNVAAVNPLATAAIICFTVILFFVYLKYVRKPGVKQK